LNLPPAASTRRRFLSVQQVCLMRILFDQGVPRGLTASLRGHEVTEARKLKWERISNGELLELAEGAGFDLLLTTDKNVRYQQNLADRKISIVVLENSPWWLVRQHLDAIAAAVNAATPGSYTEVEIPFK
jgi:hypothetical protein